MGTQLTQVPEKVADKYSREATELGLSRAEYARQRIEAGRLLFDSSGKVDTQLLRTLVDDDETVSIDTDLNTLDSELDGDLADSILANLATSEDRALTQEELRRAVFGTKDEQLEQIESALKHLKEEEKIEPLIEGGYIKTND